jgi:hypothetical protein
MLVGSQALERVIDAFSDFLTATCETWTAIERGELIQNTFWIEVVKYDHLDRLALQPLYHISEITVSPDTEWLCDNKFAKSHALVLPILNQKKFLYRKAELY